MSVETVYELAIAIAVKLTIKAIVIRHFFKPLDTKYRQVFWFFIFSFSRISDNANPEFGIRIYFL